MDEFEILILSLLLLPKDTCESIYYLFVIGWYTTSVTCSQDTSVSSTSSTRGTASITHVQIVCWSYSARVCRPAWWLLGICFERCHIHIDSHHQFSSSEDEVGIIQYSDIFSMSSTLSVNLDNFDALLLIGYDHINYGN